MTTNPSAKTPWNPSKKAIKRVLNAIPAPETCPFCSSPVAIKSHDELYGRTYGEWPWAYVCQKKACGAYVGMHPFTNIPLGTLADAATRDARKKAKDLFQRLWLNGGMMNRTQAYEWLALKLNIPYAACHFGWFDVAACTKARECLEKELGLPPPAPPKPYKELVKEF